ncbi:MAG TPA: MFS transporter [Pseudolysinimonas sp.]|nr:MFS transporter [Pseudolysinimonas sp.]
MSLAATPARTFIALTLTVGGFTTLQSLLVPVLSEIQSELRTTPAGVTWTLTAWFLTAAVATPLLGRIGDMFGKRRMLLLATVAVAAGSLTAVLAPTIEVLLLARVIQGLGGAIYPLAFGIVRDTFPAARVPGRIGILSAIIAVASGLGIVLAGPLSDILGWRGLFLVPLALVAIGGVLTVLFVPESVSRSGGRVNIPAALLLGGWLVALLLPLSNGAEWGWSSPAVIALFAAAAVLLVAWIVVELRSRQPLIDVRMMRASTVWTTNAAGLFIGATMYGVFSFFPGFVQAPPSSGFGFGASVSESGLLMLPMLAMMAVGGFLNGPLSKIISLRTQFASSSALIGLATISIALVHTAAWQVSIAAGVFGVGLGLAVAAMPSLIMQGVPASQTGVATGMNANFRTIGSAVGTSLMAAIIAGSVTGSGAPTEAGYSAGFLTLAALAAGAAGIALLGHLRRHPVALLNTGSTATVPGTVRETRLDGNLAA